PERPCGDQQQAAAGDEQLGADEDQHGVAPGEDAVQAQSHQDAGEQVRTGGVDHRCSPPFAPVNPATAKAPISAASSNRESSSKGHTQVEKICRPSSSVPPGRTSTRVAVGSSTAATSPAVPAPTSAARAR